jgi:hypothetical protein
MIAGVILSLLVATAAVAFVVAPLMRKDAAEAERVAMAISELEELQSRREMLLVALKDLEDDRVTNKINNEDYAELHARLTGQAVEVMKQIDAREEPRVKPD